MKLNMVAETRAASFTHAAKVFSIIQCAACARMHMATIVLIGCVPNRIKI